MHDKYAQLKRELALHKELWSACTNLSRCSWLGSLQL